MKAILTILMVAWLISPLTAHGYSQQDEQQFLQELINSQIGEVKEGILLKKREQAVKHIKAAFDQGKIDAARKEKMIDAAYKKYKSQSRKLVAKYREPMVKQLKKMFPSMDTGAGTDLFTTNENGQVILNPKHRGWQGDHDLAGSSADVDKAKKLFEKYGFQPTGMPAEMTVESLQVTVNKDTMDHTMKQRLERLKTEAKSLSGKSLEVNKATQANLEDRIKSHGDTMDRPGTSAHETRQTQDAASKEVAQSYAMKDGQPGKRATQVQDHIKKAVEGLGMPPSELIKAKNEGVFQNMSKGTLKSIADGKVTPAQLKQAAQNFPGGEKRYTELLDKFKHGVKAGDLIDERTLASFQDVSNQVVDAAQTNSLKAADKELAGLKNKIKVLDKRAATAAPEDLRAIVRKQNQFRSELIDSKVRLKTSIDANEARRLKYGIPKKGTPPATLVPDLQPPRPTSGTTPRALTKTKIAAGVLDSLTSPAARARSIQRAGTAGKWMNIYELATSVQRHAETYADEEDTNTAINKTIFAATMDLAGISGIKHVFTDELDLAAKEEAKLRAAGQSGIAGEYARKMVAGIRATGKLAWGASVGAAVEAGKGLGQTLLTGAEAGQAIRAQWESEAILEEKIKDEKFREALKKGENRMLLGSKDSDMMLLKEIHDLEWDAGRHGPAVVPARGSKAALDNFLSNVQMPKDQWERWEQAKKLQKLIQAETEAVIDESNQMPEDGIFHSPAYYEALQQRVKQLEKAADLASRYIGKERAAQKLSSSEESGIKNTGTMLRSLNRSLKRDLGQLDFQLTTLVFDARKNEERNNAPSEPAETVAEEPLEAVKPVAQAFTERQRLEGRFSHEKARGTISIYINGSSAGYKVEGGINGQLSGAAADNAAPEERGVIGEVSGSYTPGTGILTGKVKVQDPYLCDSSGCPEIDEWPLEGYWLGNRMEGRLGPGGNYKAAPFRWSKQAFDEANKNRPLGQWAIARGESLTVNQNSGAENRKQVMFEFPTGAVANYLTGWLEGSVTPPADPSKFKGGFKGKSLRYYAHIKGMRNGNGEIVNGSAVFVDPETFLVKDGRPNQRVTGFVDPEGKGKLILHPDPKAAARGGQPSTIELK